MSENEKMNNDIAEDEAVTDASENSQTAENADDALNEVKKKEKKTEQRKNVKADKKLAEALAERDDFKDKYQRTFSEFNNYKKRTASTRAEAFKDGQCDVVSKMLPVLDNFERALEHIEGGEDDAVVQGFKMVYKQMTMTIEQMGVAEMGTPGDVFDPNCHQAIQMVEPKEGEESGTIAGVVQKGYKMDDRVIRHCMVMVNK